MPDRPLLVLLLPCRLEEFPRRDLAERLLASPSAVAVEPPRVPYGRLVGLGDTLSAVLAGMQAKRMRLPGTPRAVALFDPLQYPLARALVARHPECELWYGPPEGAAGELHELAGERAGLRFEDSEQGRSALAAAIDRAGLELS
jgi:hypothetical protein